MRRIIDNAARHKSNSEIEEDDRQHAGAKGALESFGQFVAILNAENKQHADQAKQSTRGSRRRVVAGFDQKTSDHAWMRTGNHGQVTRQYAGNSGNYPKHYELCRAIKFLDP